MHLKGDITTYIIYWIGQVLQAHINDSTFARIYRGLVVIRLTISTNAELTLKLISKLSAGAVKKRRKIKGDPHSSKTKQGNAPLVYAFNI